MRRSFFNYIYFGHVNFCDAQTMTVCCRDRGKGTGIDAWKYTRNLSIQKLLNASQNPEHMQQQAEYYLKLRPFPQFIFIMVFYCV
jgi:hypothetical protein